MLNVDRHQLRFSSVLTVVLLLGLVLSLVPVSIVGATAPPPSPSDWDIALGGHFYSQTGGDLGRGFAVTDVDGIGMWRDFRRYGGVEALGYPVSRRLIWQGSVIQVFQRAVLQWSPEEGRARPLNVLDLLHDQGKDDWLLAVKGVPKPFDAAAFDQGKSWEQIVSTRQALLNQNPAMKAKYFSASDPFSLYGLPTSQIVDVGPFLAIRLQRAVIQQWKSDVPWAKAGQVTVALAGDLAREAGLLPAGDYWIAEDAAAMPPKWGSQIGGAPIPAGERWIDVSVKDQSITAMVGTTPVYRAPCTTGKPAFPTPIGTFSIIRRVYNDTMDSLTLGVPRDSSEGYHLKDVYFTQYFLGGGYAIHANYWMPDEVFGNYASSHGCVGMRYHDAKWFWDFADYGTRIVVHQ